MKLNLKKVILFGLVFSSITLMETLHNSLTSKILDGVFNMDSTKIGTVLSLDNIIALILLPLMGFISDRTEANMGKRKIFILIGTILVGATLIVIPIAAETANLAFFLAMIVLNLSAAAFYRTPAVSLLSDFVPKPLRSKGNGVIALESTAFYLIAYVLIMFLYTDIDASGTRKIPLVILYGVIAIIGIIMALVYVLFIPEKRWVKERLEEEKKYGVSDSSPEDVAVLKKIDFSYLDKGHKKSLLLILLTIFFYTLGYNAVYSFFTLYTEKILGYTDGSFAIVLTIASLAGVIAAIPSALLGTKIGRRKTIIIGASVLTIAFLLGSFISIKWLMIAVFIFVGTGVAFININSLPMITEFSKADNVGSFTGLYYLSCELASIIAPIFCGKVMDICAKYGVMGNGGYLVLFPFGFVFLLLAVVPMIFVKHGDSKAEIKPIIETMASD